jgi:hypothetical protein
MTAATRTYEHVQLDANGVPLIAGTNMKVVELVMAQFAHGWSPEELFFQHPSGSCFLRTKTFWLKPHSARKKHSVCGRRLCPSTGRYHRRLCKGPGADCQSW